MKTKFTPGPWGMTASKNSLGDFVCNIHQSDDAKYTPNYSDVATTIAGERESIQKANAHLIACAPDMYEMLEKCQQKFGALGYYSRVEEIESLLKRARGEHE